MLRERERNVPVPRVKVPVGQDDLGVGVGGDELRGEGGGGQVTHGLAMAEQAVPVLFCEVALAVPLGTDGAVPHLAVTGRLGAGGAHVVGLEVAQGPEGCSDSWGDMLALCTRYKRRGQKGHNTHTWFRYGRAPVLTPS